MPRTFKSHGLRQETQWQGCTRPSKLVGFAQGLAGNARGDNDTLGRNEHVLNKASMKSCGLGPPEPLPVQMCSDLKR